MLHQAEHLRRERVGRLGERAGTIHPARELHHVAGRHVRDRPLVQHVDDLLVAGTGVERRDECRGGVGVPRAPALLQELRLRVERRVTVELQQPGLDLEDLLGAGTVRALVFQHVTRPVVVAEVRAGDRAQRANELDRRCLRELLGSLGEQLGQPVHPVDEHRAHPREVVEPDVVKPDVRWLDLEVPRELALDADRDVA